VPDTFLIDDEIDMDKIDNIASTIKFMF
jgi:hypothetical protein